ncbi:MAG: hypothetical protein ACSLE8_06275 [Rhodococcus sp. (in: high G+C Gram-positive bacteria)]
MKNPVKRHVTVTGIVHLSAHGAPGGEPVFVLYGADMSEFGHAPLGPASFEFELPDNFNPSGARILILEKERERINAEFAKRVKAINEQISKLQSIEFNGVTQ